MRNQVLRPWLAIFLSFFTILASPSSASAQEASVNVRPEYQNRSVQLLEILQGSEDEEDFFAASFLEAIPVVQFRSLVTHLQTQYGTPTKISQIIPASDFDGTVEISYTRATVAIRLVLDGDAPHPVIGLQLTGGHVTEDNLESISEIIEALPGVAGFEVTDISEAAPRVIAAHNSDYSFAIGSTFKLYVLSTLARQIESGQRNWDDIASLDHKSLPSGILQNWPDNAPLTLQTLATLMISISDNSATDILINLLGRQEIALTVRNSGHANPDKTLPILTTLEAFALKMPANKELRERFAEASEIQQVALLETEKSRMSLDKVSIANLATLPRFINEIEWFSSPKDINNLLHQLAKKRDPIVEKILSLNTIIPPGDALRWEKIGGKGGSEPGVVSFAFLGETKSGRKYAISGSWNNSNAAVQNEKFLLTMNRLLNIISRQ